MKFVIFALFIVTQSTALNLIDPENPSQYIVGGSDAQPEQFPYLVSMRRTENRQHICGAAIVNARWILTAAHCITANNIQGPEDFYNVAGTISATSDDGDWYETLLYVLHPEWNPAIVRHDICLVQTIEDIHFSMMVMSVRLMPDRWAGNVTATMAGFGQTRVEPRTDVKQYLEMETMANPDCRRFYASNPFNAIRIFDSNICLYNAAGRGTCGGDSGGSVVVDQISVGIASWVGTDCALGNPDVYVRTAHYYYWIRNVTELIRIEE